ncbi:dihydrolipoamide succinyltransferase component (E2) of 2-oxoglutarate dehydrogenase complex [Halorhodospira halochloris]|uniref:Dihydrolipoyllysine-residue succinyltransferase component of 2-oxoglutarate dehydrogenase complex n=1 Tax=Halorhodospira halochloris TaxID=1052 RepID=A0A0X8X889_HALHR|nr:2-oxoglutarate dehydrogenase complex dihydrolipoyllysine-residue succinyltransferase [Halorhodospira halochloris]MBK1650729.1 dihydrolipoyllysine-residue succinyltransferase [Halorhodospira halochloris]BAU56778.1 dihydrolipoamide succinyltransferase component (E2) of 2-oxoglutarate dehydrogenase complex [Halorhodospira halochloris]
MSVEIKVPELPESVAEATVVAWHKQPGDKVARDENLVDLETDKVVLEVPSPADGVLGPVHKPVGEVVTADEVLGAVEHDNGPGSVTEVAPEATPAKNQESPQSGSAGSASAQSDDRGAEPGAREADETETDPAAEAPNQVNLDDLSPAVRRLVMEHDLDASLIEASSQDGRLTKEDVLRHLEQGKPTVGPEAQAAAAAPALGERPEERVPMTRLRQRIAERLVEAQRTAAMLTTFNEVDMQPVMDIRSRYRDRFEKMHDVRLGFMSFFVKAVIEALKRYPAVNASIDGSDIVYHGYYDIGIAVSSPRGLVVPVVRDADQLSFAEIEAQINELGRKAQAGKLAMDELTGGTFTITNGGIFGSLLSTPILNPPQSGILGMHKIQERPVAQDGEVVIKPMMYLAHSYDHRLIDGREAVQFLVTVKEQIEDPARLLLEV